jgi:hypothetical protein
LCWNLYQSVSVDLLLLKNVLSLWSSLETIHTWREFWGFHRGDVSSWGLLGFEEGYRRFASIFTQKRRYSTSRRHNPEDLYLRFRLGCLLNDYLSINYTYGIQTNKCESCLVTLIEVYDECKAETPLASSAMCLFICILSKQNFLWFLHVSAEYGSENLISTCRFQGPFPFLFVVTVRLLIHERQGITHCIFLCTKFTTDGRYSSKVFPT